MSLIDSDWRIYGECEGIILIPAPRSIRSTDNTLVNPHFFDEMMGRKKKSMNEHIFKSSRIDLIGVENMANIGVY